jgi:hypothetical protein
MNYGVKFDTAFKDGIHDLRDKKYDSTRGRYYARDQMKWYLRKVRRSTSSY